MLRFTTHCVLAALVACCLSSAHALEPGTYVAGIDGSGALRVAGPTEAAWLPSSDRLLLATRNSLYTIGADGSGKAQLYKDPKLLDIDALRVSASGRFAAATVMVPPAREEWEWYGTGRLRVWALANGRLLLDRWVYEVTEGGGGFEWAWSRLTDRLAWCGEGAEGETSDELRLHDPVAGEQGVLARGIAPLCLAWRPDRDTIIASARTRALVELDPEPGSSNPRTVLPAPSPGREDGPDLDAGELTLLPQGRGFFCGRTEAAGFFDTEGGRLEPRLGEGYAIRKCYWASATDRRVIIGIETEGQGGAGIETVLHEGEVGTPLGRFRTLATLPAAPDAVLVAPDASKVAFTVPPEEGMHVP